MKKLLFALLAALTFGGAAFAAQVTITQEGTFSYTPRTQINNMFTDLYNAVYNSAAIPAGLVITSNPLEHMTLGRVTTAQANSAVTILTGKTGLAVYPSGGFTIMASGTASGATSIDLKCSSGRLITTWPIAMLVDHLPVGMFSSAGGATTTTASGITQGCPSGDGVMLSAQGTLATTTYLYYTMPYVVQ